MEVRAKKALGQHFLTDQDIARRIVGALQGSPVLEVGPGMGVLTQYLIPSLAGQAPEPGRIHSRFAAAECGLSSAPAPATQLKAVEIDKESVAYLKKHFPELGDGLIEGDFLKMDLGSLFPGQFSIIGNFPYNISSQIFFKIIDNRDLVPEVVCMVQKEVAERIAEKPGTKTYGILSVFLQAWYDIEYLFTVGSGAFNPPPKVQSAVIRLTRNSRTSLRCDEKLFRSVVKTAFGQRRKTLRNSLKPLIQKAGALSGPGRVHSRSAAAECGLSPAAAPASAAEAPVLDLRPERLSVEDFIALTLLIFPPNG
ncbi:MAG: ribosomal RNA small subunit methyltransferase A [Bacteroidales bacterium]|nr:ribosomal RNA small subunit methyltransferase A [Bacteroidales bacterium]